MTHDTHDITETELPDDLSAALACPFCGMLLPRAFAAPPCDREALIVRGAWARLPGETKAVMRLIADGRTAREVAELRCLSARTVEGHVARALDALSAPNATAAACKLAAAGVL